MPSPSPLAPALRRLRAPLALIGGGALLIALPLGLLKGVGALPLVLGAVLPILLLGAQYGFLSRACAPGANALAWVLASYPVRILIAVIGLYLPRLGGADVRFPALLAIVVILLSMLAEAVVIVRTPQLTVDERD